MKAEDIKLVAGWAGFTKGEGMKTFRKEGGTLYTQTNTWWKTPKVGKYWGEYEYLPNFASSLDACVKWLVPNHISEITFMYASNCVSCDIEDLKGHFFEGHVNVASIEEAWAKSAEALCQAILKLIKDTK